MIAVNEAVEMSGLDFPTIHLFVGTNEEVHQILQGTDKYYIKINVKYIPILLRTTNTLASQVVLQWHGASMGISGTCIMSPKH